MASFKEHGNRPRGFWTSPNDEEPRLFVLVSVDEGADPVEVGERYIQNSEFLGDPEGFDVSKISRVDSLVLSPTADSPPQ